MNTFNRINKPADISTLDDVRFWGLNEPSRFPATPEEWDCLNQLPVLPDVTMSGHHAYDLAINCESRRPATHTMRNLLAAFPDDYQAASNLLDPIQWRLLYYLDLYPMSVLANPSCDPAGSIQTILSQDASYRDVPGSWIGTCETAADLSWDIRARICDTTPDIAKATWSILSFVRQLGLEKNEVLVLPWWRIWWIERYLKAAR